MKEGTHTTRMGTSGSFLRLRVYRCTFSVNTKVCQNGCENEDVKITDQVHTAHEAVSVAAARPNRCVRHWKPPGTRKGTRLSVRFPMCAQNNCASSMKFVVLILNSVKSLTPLSEWKQLSHVACWHFHFSELSAFELRRRNITKGRGIMHHALISLTCRGWFRFLGKSLNCDQLDWICGQFRPLQVNVLRYLWRDTIKVHCRCLLAVSSAWTILETRSNLGFCNSPCPNSTTQDWLMLTSWK